MHVTIRPAESLDRQAIAEVNQIAFAGGAEAHLVESLTSGGFVEVSLVAEVDGEIVGHILFSRVSIVTRAGSLDAQALAPMAVVPSYQRRGIGSKLVVAGLKVCRERGQKIVVVLGHPAFYPRFGFTTEMARKLESPFGSGPEWMAMELVPGALMGVEGRVKFSPAFAAFE